ncbi:MAG: rhomboid family intramembrane serine protease [Planctomycetota bacterium]|nr:MAG: rhomboid family intramembrane serine protease [Planctomycetota bacterium]
MLPLKDHNPIFSTPFVTYALVAINTAIMLYVSSLGSIEQQTFDIEHGFIPARVAQLSNPQQKVEVPIYQEVALQGGRVALKPVKKIELKPAAGAVLASLLSSMFIHGGWMHLAGNMWFLWIFGNNIEDRLGHALYALFYVVGGLLATACHWAYDPASMVPVIGASGAVSTILGAYAVTYPKATVSTLIFFGFITIVEIPALVWLAVWLGGQLVDAFFQKDLGVAVWAHIGGFAAGAFLMPILSFGAPPPGSSWQEELKKHFSFDFDQTDEA